MADEAKPVPAPEAVPAGSLSEQIDQDLAAAEAALAAEEAAAVAAQTPAAEPATDPAAAAPAPAPAPATAPDPAPAGDGRPPMPQSVPIARFQEVVAQRHEAAAAYQRAVEEGNASRREIAQLREHLQRLTGQVEGMQRAGAVPAAAPPVQQTDPVAVAENELMALAAKYEAGGMSATEYERQRLPLARQHAKAIAQAEAVGVTQAARQYDAQTRPAPAPSSDLYLEDQTRQMEEANPWVRRVPDELIAGLKPAVLRYCQERGIHVGNDARGNRNLRAGFIQLAREMRLPEIYGGGTEPAPAMPVVPTSANPVPRLPVPANQPPNLGHRGAGPVNPGGISKEALLAMSPEQRLELHDKAPQVLESFASG